MKRLLVGAAVLAASVVGADISAISYISGSAGMAALAQESQGSSAAAGNDSAVRCARIASSSTVPGFG